MKFCNLPIGALFVFTPSKDGFHHDRNTYEKLSARVYQKSIVNVGATSYRVGSINVEVEVVS